MRKTNTWGSKALVLLLAAVMALVVMPVAAQASEIFISNYGDLQNEAASTTSTHTIIKLEDNIADGIAQLTVNRNLTLDLNGKTLTITVSSENGIKIANDVTLTIQDSGTGGELTTGNTLTGNVRGAGAGINTTDGTLIINSGTVKATGGTRGAGIGGGGGGTGNGGSGGTIMINGGTVSASGGTGAGIGGGGGGTGNNGGSGGAITINGGTVTATSRSNGAGIGGGSATHSSSGTSTTPQGGSGGSITINGGTVTATAAGNDNRGAGIGGGGNITSTASSSSSRGGPSGTIRITGGTITATAGSHDSSYAGSPVAIGRGALGNYGPSYGSVTISLTNYRYWTNTTTTPPDGEGTEGTLTIPDNNTFKYVKLAAIPTAPENFTATPGNTLVMLTWTAPATNGSAVTGYEVSSDDGDGADWVTASSNTSHTFDSLTNDTSYTFRVRAVTAELKGAEVTATAMPTNGSATTYAVTVSSEGTDATDSDDHEHGSIVYITAGTPPEGKRFKNWTADPSVVFADPNSANTSFIMPNSEVEVTANFETITYTITASAGANGTITSPSITSPGIKIVNHGENSETFTITPSSAAYEIDDVKVDGVSNPGAVTSGSYTFNNVTQNHTIHATFKPKTSSSVGVQAGPLSARTTGTETGTVTFPVTTQNIANGNYTVSVSNLPTGVTVQGPVNINNNFGTLTLAGSDTTQQGTTNNLTLTINGATSNNFTLTVSPKQITKDMITPTAQEKQYDGNANATITGMFTTGTIIGDDVTIALTGEFADANAGEDKTVNITTWTLVGNGAENYALDPATPSGFTTTANINQKPLADDMVSITDTGPFTYNGSAQTPDYTVTDGSLTITEDSDYTAGWSNNTNAGTATLTITATQAGNYSGTASATFTIDKKTPELSDLSVNIPTDHIYNGSPQGFSVTGADGLGTITVKYNGNATVPTNAGTYTVTADIADSGANYNAATGISLGDYTIGKAAVTGITSTVSNIERTAYEAYTTDGATSTPLIIEKYLPENVTVSTDTGGNYDLPITWTTATAYDAKGAAYTFTGTLTGTENIDTGSVTETVTVTITPVTHDNPTFADTEVAIGTNAAATAADLGESVLPTSGSYQFHSVDINYTIAWDSGITLDTTKAEEEQTFAGTVAYTNPPWFTPAVSDAVSRKVTVSGKTQVTISGITAITGIEYDGTPQTGVDIINAEAGAANVSGLIYYYEGTNESGVAYDSAIPPTDAGNYECIVTLDDPAYFAQPISITFRINPKPLTWNTDGVTVTPRSYESGNVTADLAGQLALTGVIGGDTVTLTPGSMTGQYDNENAGTGKTVTITLSGYSIDNSNYLLPTATSFAKTGNINALVFTGSVTISNNAPKVGDTLTASVTSDAGSHTYAWNGAGSPTNGSSYTVAAADTGNTLTVTIGTTNTNYTGTFTSSPTAAVEGIQPATYAVTVESEGTGATGGGDYEEGDTVTIYAGTPPTGQQFVNWTTASSGVFFDNANNANTSFIMPANPVTATANFMRSDIDAETNNTIPFDNVDKVLEAIKEELGFKADDFYLDHVSENVFVKEPIVDAIIAKLIAEKKLPEDHTEFVPFGVVSADVASGKKIAQVRIPDVEGAALGVSFPKDIKLLKIISPDYGVLLNHAATYADFDDGKFTLLKNDGNISEPGDIAGAIESNGSYDLVVFILDGGYFDLDGKEDGKVIDPLVIVNAEGSVNPLNPDQPNPNPSPNPSQPTPRGDGMSGGGGCDSSAGMFGTLALLSVLSGVGLSARRRKKNG